MNFELIGICFCRHSYKESLGEGARVSKLTSVAFQKETHILVSGFKDGSFYLHELPDFNLIHSLRYIPLLYCKTNEAETLLNILSHISHLTVRPFSQVLPVI